jgi:hypothetical protein
VSARHGPAEGAAPNRNWRSRGVGFQHAASSDFSKQPPSMKRQLTEPQPAGEHPATRGSLLEEAETEPPITFMFSAAL